MMGARLEKHVELRPGDAIVYQRHTFDGGAGACPSATTPCSIARTDCSLGFAPCIWAGTPPEAIETPPTGRTLLAYPQEIDDLDPSRSRRRRHRGPDPVSTFEGP